MLKPQNMARVLEEEYGFDVRHVMDYYDSTGKERQITISYRFGSFEGIDVEPHGEMLKEHGYKMVGFNGNNTISIEPV